MGFLTRDQILSAQDLKTEEVSVPEWGGSVLVRGLTGVERDQFESALIEGKGKNQKVNMTNLRAKLVAASVVDDQGERVFRDSDVVALGKKSASALSRVFSVAQRLSGLTDEDMDELTEVLKESPFDGSSSSSPES